MKIRSTVYTIFSLLVLFACIVFYLNRAKTSGDYYGNTDFYKFYQSVLFYFSGQNTYSPTILQFKFDGVNKWVTGDGNLNPPFLTLLFLPFHHYNYAEALRMWVKLSVLFTIGGVLLLLRSFPEFIKTHGHTLLITTAFMIYMPNSGNFAYGQVTGLLLLLLIGTWLAARHHYEKTAGLLLGLAASIKLFCGLFFIYFLITRRFKIFGAATITYLTTFIFALWFFGINDYEHYRKIITSVNWFAASWNPSFLGFFTRLFSGAEKNIPLINLPYLVRPLTYLCSGVLMIYLLVTWNRFRHFTSALEERHYFDQGFSLTVISMLLLSPFGWIYYFPILVIPYFILVQQAGYLKKGYLVHLGACLAIFISTLTTDLLMTNDVKTPRQVLLDGGYALYALLLFLGLHIYLAQKRLNHHMLAEPYAIMNSRLPRPEPEMISENLWVVIYFLMLVPSMYSLLKIAEHLINVLATRQ